MPDERPAPVIPEANLEAEPLKLGLQAIEDSYALSLVKQTFWGYEWFRSQNHDARWNVHDALYTGWVPQKVWEGTTTPRSSLGMPISFSQVETAFPAIYQAIFSEDNWFQVAPAAGTVDNSFAPPAPPPQQGPPPGPPQGPPGQSPQGMPGMPGQSPQGPPPPQTPPPPTPGQEATAIQAHLKYSLEHPKDDYTGNAEIELELAIKQMLQHGNGGVEILWDAEAGHSRVEWVDIRDFYVDPATPVPSVDAARSLIRRKLFTVNEIDDLRHDPRMRIPDKAILMNMARNLNTVFADQTKQVSEALRGVQYNPAQYENSPLPSERRIEVLIYYSKHRIIWVFNREWIAYNERNAYGFVPFAFAPCFPIPGRFYAMSYLDVIENPQRYIEALYNGRLDELSLSLRPPRVRKRGSILTPAQQRWHPGQVMEVEDPSKDLSVLYPQGATVNIMDDVSYLEIMVERLTGANAVTGGTPRPGNANRTATGMNLQAQGGNSRLWPLVKHVEDYLIVPMLYKMYKMVQCHTHPGQTLPALGTAGQTMQVGAHNFQQGCKFTINASSKMLTRDKLAQIVPFLMQYMLNGPFIQGLQGMGQTVDFEVFAQMLQDATGTGDKYKLIRPMNPQEQQAKQTPPPGVVAQQQKVQSDQQTRMQLMQMKTQAELQKAQIMKAPPPPDPAQQQADQQAQQQDAMKSMVEMAIARQKAEMQQKQAVQKLTFDHLDAQQKLALERQKHQQKLFLDAAQGQQTLRQQQQEHLQKFLTNHVQAQQDLAHNQAAGEQDLAQSKAQSEHSMNMEKMKLKLQSAQQRQMRAKPTS